MMTHSDYAIIAHHNFEQEKYHATT